MENSSSKKARVAKLLLKSPIWVIDPRRSALSRLDRRSSYKPSSLLSGAPSLMNSLASGMYAAASNFGREALNNAVATPLANDL
jgi:hypothetical protein